MSILLSEEHDRYEWMAPEKVADRCRPDIVSEPLKRAGVHLKGLEQG